MEWLFVCLQLLHQLASKVFLLAVHHLEDCLFFPPFCPHYFCVPTLTVFSVLRFFVLGKEQMHRTSSINRPSDENRDNSLTAVVYGMVQVRKKQTLGSSLSVPSKQQIKKNLEGSSSNPSPKLSVTFSLRKKSKKVDQRLKRIASDKPDKLKNKTVMTTGPVSEGCFDSIHSAAGSQLLETLDAKTVCHSSPDLNLEVPSTASPKQISSDVSGGCSSRQEALSEAV